MKRYIRSSVDTSSLKALGEDMLYQTWENSRYDGYTKRDALESVFDHVKLVITEMDDDGNYSEYLRIFNEDERRFDTLLRKVAKQVVDEHYYDYDWRE